MATCSIDETSSLEPRTHAHPPNRYAVANRSRGKLGLEQRGFAHRHDNPTRDQVACHDWYGERRTRRVAARIGQRNARAALSARRHEAHLQFGFAEIRCAVLIDERREPEGQRHQRIDHVVSGTRDASEARSARLVARHGTGAATDAGVVTGRSRKLVDPFWMAWSRRTTARSGCARRCEYGGLVSRSIRTLHRPSIGVEHTRHTHAGNHQNRDESSCCQNGQPGRRTGRGRSHFDRSIARPRSYCKVRGTLRLLRLDAPATRRL